MDEANKRQQKEEYRRYKRRYLETVEVSEDAFVKLGDREISTDLAEIARLVHFFAARYGLGANKSISEFWDMIDNEDKTRLNLLRMAAIEEYNAMCVGDDEEEREFSTAVREHHRRTRPSASREVTTDVGMAAFILNMGGPSEEVQKALAELKDRKIDNKTDFASIDWLNIPREEFEKKYDEYIKVVKGSKNFEVSMATLRAKERKAKKKK